MNLWSTMQTTAKSDIPKEQAMVIILQRLPQYIIRAGLGLLGGAMGVAAAIGLAVVVQLLLPPAVIFSPGVIQLTVAATLAGLGISWLLDRAVDRILPSPFYSFNEQGLQVILIFSILTSLLETLLFTNGL